MADTPNGSQPPPKDEPVKKPSERPITTPRPQASMYRSASKQPEKQDALWLESLSLLQIFKTTLSVFVQAPASFLLLTLLPYLVCFFIAWTSFKSVESALKLSQSIGGLIGVGGMATTITLIILGPLSLFAMARLTYNLLHEIDHGLIDILKEALMNYPRVALSMLLFATFVAGTYVLKAGVFLPGIGMKITNPTLGNLYLTVMTPLVLGYALFYIWGMMLFLQVLVFRDDVGTLESLYESYRYTALIVPKLKLLVIHIALMLILYLLDRILPNPVTPANYNNFYAVMRIIPFILSIPIFCIANTVFALNQHYQKGEA